jgi:hypothetical protein
MQGKGSNGGKDAGFKTIGTIALKGHAFRRAVKAKQRIRLQPLREQALRA